MLSCWWSIMTVILSVVGAIFAVFFVVMIHELGHFVVAKSAGVKVLRFSIGFGRAIWSKKTASGTEFIVAMIPLGGYVQMYGHSKSQVEAGEENLAYAYKPLWARMLIVLAGPIINMLLAFLMFWIVFMIGVNGIKPIIGQVIPNSIAAQTGIKSGLIIKAVDGEPVKSWSKVLVATLSRIGEKGDMAWTLQNPTNDVLKTYQLPLSTWTFNSENSNALHGLGVVPYEPKPTMQVAKIIKHSPAEKVGLRQGDKIMRFDNQPIHSWSQLVSLVKAKPTSHANLMVERAKQRMVFSVDLGIRPEDKKTEGFLGVIPQREVVPEDYRVRLHYSAWQAVYPAWQQVVSLTAFNALVVKKLIFGEISTKVLGGPVTVFATAGKASTYGVVAYLSFIGFISLMLGFINVLPIPGLDGGHFMFQVVELLKGSPVSERVQQISLYVGFALLGLIFLLAISNDLARFF